jgi:hypothetical protein
MKVKEQKESVSASPESQRSSSWSCPRYYHRQGIKFQDRFGDGRETASEANLCSSRVREGKSVWACWELKRYFLVILAVFNVRGFVGANSLMLFMKFAKKDRKKCPNKSREIGRSWSNLSGLELNETTVRLVEERIPVSTLMCWHGGTVHIWCMSVCFKPWNGTGRVPWRLIWIRTFTVLCWTMTNGKLSK